MMGICEIHNLVQCFLKFSKLFRFSDQKCANVILLTEKIVLNCIDCKNLTNLLSRKIVHFEMFHTRNL